MKPSSIATWATSTDSKHRNSERSAPFTFAIQIGELETPPTTIVVQTIVVGGVLYLGPCNFRLLKNRKGTNCSCPPQAQRFISSCAVSAGTWA
jgi:hypothetical protein